VNCEAATAYPLRLEVLNKKCRFFWRLDGIFGTMPDNNHTLPSQDLPSEPRSQSQTNPLMLGSDIRPESANNALTSPPPTTAASTPSNAPPPVSPMTQLRPKSSASARRNKGDGEVIKRLVDLNRGDWGEREEKRQKIQADAQIEVARIQAESQERIVEKQLQIQREMQREERQLQREREERQLQMFQGMMSSMIQIVTAKSNQTNNDSS
jgi:hypothetical protein